jgi:hypothetical protein
MLQYRAIVVIPLVSPSFTLHVVALGPVRTKRTLAVRSELRKIFLACI